MRLRKNTILKWCLLALLIGYTCWVTVWAHRQAALHVCKDIEISVVGNPKMDSVVRSGIMQELRDYPARIIGSPLSSIDTRKIEKYLEHLGNFERVNCVITAGGIMKVEAVPLVPVMRVFFADRSYYINKEGRHMDSNAEFFADVPVVTGVFTHDFQPRQVLPLVRYLERDDNLRELTSMIVARSADNLIIVPRVKGHVINFGDTTRLAEKSHALMLFYRKVMPYKGWNEYDTISVKFKGQVVATRRDKTRLNHAEQQEESEDLEEATLPFSHDPQAEPGAERTDAASPETAPDRQTTKTPQNAG